MVFSVEIYRAWQGKSNPQHGAIPPSWCCPELLLQGGGRGTRSYWGGTSYLSLTLGAESLPILTRDQMLNAKRDT